MSDLLPEEVDALGAISRRLRADGWLPKVRHICGCSPFGICEFHAEARAMDHYNAQRRHA